MAGSAPSRRRPARRSGWWVTAAVAAYAAGAVAAAWAHERHGQELDAAAWGSDHVGKPPPEYAAGDECLFCHRRDVGPIWSRNPHNRTLRPVAAAGPEGTAALAALKAEPALRPFAAEPRFLLGRRRRIRFLKPAAAYGQLELLSVQWRPAAGRRPGRLLRTAAPRWDARRFGDACAGCHATAVDPATRAFAAAAVDCSACHGLVDPGHSTDPSLVLLSPRRRDSARVTTSICASCHLRSGRSRSSGCPYPNNFVPGDNLFRDFQVHFSAAALAALNPADRHVVENVRDVALLGRSEVTCLSCHDEHRGATVRHRRLARRPYCDSCHQPGGTKVRPSTVSSPTCEY